jgi:hypothetical protein
MGKRKKGMTQADYKIREGLIALMCVGDTIFHLHGEDETSNYHLKVVRTCTILEIHETTIKVIDTTDNPYVVDINLIDEYNGYLYIWTATGWYGSNNYERRLEKMDRILKSADLLWW